MGDLSATEERIYEEREDARTMAGGLRKETTPRHERFDGPTSIWTEWFSSYNANMLVPYALGKAPPRPVPRADGAGSSEGESTGPEWVFSPADSLQLLQEYVEINAVTRPIIEQWQKDTLRYQQQTLSFDPASGRIRVPSREDADAFHEFRYRRYVELFETKFNEAPKKAHYVRRRRTRYDAYTREGFRETPASLAMTLRELKVHLPDLMWDKVNQKAFDVMTSVWRSIPALKQSLDAGFHQLKDIAVLRQSHENRLDEKAAEVERYEDIAAVSVEVMAVDAAMKAHLEADEDRVGTLDLEAMFSRILEKSQAAHGATGAMRLAVEVPDPFLDCVDTDDHGTLLHGASRVELPVPEQEAPASFEGRRGGGAITSDMLDIRNQQLMQHLRTALQHAKFPGLPVVVVSDMTPEHAASKPSIQRLEATTRLTWADYTHLDLTRVFAAAVQSVYGLSLPRVSVPPLSLPSAEPQANIHPVDVVQHGVKPLESRRQLSATSSELQQLREVQRNAYPDYPEYDRHSGFYVDCKLTVIVIGGVRIQMALLDTGCDYSGVHRRVVDRMKPGEADATL
eukprot:jgi/Tetstr1/457217/TSEL_043865.t1